MHRRQLGHRIHQLRTLDHIDRNALFRSRSRVRVMVVLMHPLCSRCCTTKFTSYVEILKIRHTNCKFPDILHIMPPRQLDTRPALAEIG